MGEAEQARVDAEGAAESSVLPDAVDEKKISALIARTHLEFWKHS